ncbi:GTP-binding protein, HSR1-related [Alkaliphilus metalliredigens QYMF]|uniref:GTPase HflX n=1 Tax=Alkaliphilus metalliredigens (strain QYMF) TaxID=293826 RepID=A6TQB5_ALKMQ|nr:GTPase HflX [Alkaliphilus metalliredigens]ABR48383.1 GTP-binding protein, HSR1-related [Alkaliphilus metalliredigens QYMF]
METENLQSNKRPVAVLVGLNTTGKRKNDFDIEESMDELKELAKAAGADVEAIVIQNRPAVDVTYYIGKGKVEEIKVFCDSVEADMVIFNDVLSGSQIRNIEAAMDIDVIDRTTLILDIFAQRAQAKEGKLQVELAQLKYRMPRLKGLGKQMSKQGAGIGTRGPGEKKLETDRRHILSRIHDIEQELKEVKQNREVQRAQRKKSEIPIVAVVGYTNAGKSTLMNRLLQMSETYQEDREVFVKDMLFATLDVSLRKLVFNEKLTFILTDTVGFVSKLPHDLVNAFKATLEEVQYADLLLHVIDASNDNFEMQRKTTLGVLHDLGVQSKKIIDVYNKIDKVSDASVLPKDDNTLHISALNKINLDKLIESIRQEIGVKVIECKLLIPFADGSVVSQIHQEGTVLSTEYVEEGVLIHIKIEDMYYQKYQSYEV